MSFGQLMNDALIVSGISFGGVFLVLTLFYFIVRLMMRIFPDRPNN